jgi:hypothetical protein
LIELRLRLPEIAKIVPQSCRRGLPSPGIWLAWRELRARNGFGEVGIWALSMKPIDELASHASAAGDLTRLCTLMASGQLDGQIELECSWRQPSRALDALLQRRIGGKAVLHVD